jgi:hypothetical protein
LYLCLGSDTKDTSDSSEPDGVSSVVEEGGRVDSKMEDTVERTEGEEEEEDQVDGAQPASSMDVGKIAVRIRDLTFL